MLNGIGVYAINTDTITIGGSVAAMPGYRPRDVPEGVDRLSLGAGGRLFASVKAGGTIVTVGGTKGFVGSTKVFVADARIAYPIRATQSLLVIPSVTTTWADRRHNDRYFGISQGKSVSSGLDEYHLGSDFKDLAVGLTANYRLTNSLNLSGSIIGATLLGDSKRSSLAQNRTHTILLISNSYIIVADFFEIRRSFFR